MSSRTEILLLIVLNQNKNQNHGRLELSNKLAKVETKMFQEVFNKEQNLKLQNLAVIYKNHK